MNESDRARLLSALDRLFCGATRTETDEAIALLEAVGPFRDSGSKEFCSVCRGVGWWLRARRSATPGPPPAERPKAT